MRGYRFRTVFCCEKNHCGKATRTVHQGRGFTGSGQYSAVKKKSLRQGYQDSASGTRVYRFRTVFCCEKKKSLRQGYQDSAAGTRVYRFRTVFCCEKNHCSKARQDSASGMRVYRLRTVFCCEKNHCGKARQTVHQGREVTRSGQYCGVKKMTRQADSASGTRGYRFRTVFCC